MSIDKVMIIKYGKQVMAWNDFCAALNTFSMQAMVQGNGIC
jgi:hypothetical protein